MNNAPAKKTYVDTVGTLSLFATLCMTVGWFNRIMDQVQYMNPFKNENAYLWPLGEAIVGVTEFVIGIVFIALILFVQSRWRQREHPYTSRFIPMLFCALIWCRTIYWLMIWNKEKLVDGEVLSSFYFIGVWMNAILMPSHVIFTLLFSTLVMFHLKKPTEA